MDDAHNAIIKSLKLISEYLNGSGRSLLASKMLRMNSILPIIIYAYINEAMEYSETIKIFDEFPGIIVFKTQFENHIYMKTLFIEQPNISIKEIYDLANIWCDNLLPDFPLGSRIMDKNDAQEINEKRKITNWVGLGLFTFNQLKPLYKISR